jgi:2,4-dienoyl-CoA reductase-like NADH-dependent reductase (Old Yellow Enzyme family)
MSEIFSEGEIAGLTLPNRIIKAGCFEGMSQNGGVTPALINHHVGISKGGTAMTTVAYCSVSYDGRAFEHEMWMHDELIPELKLLTKAIHDNGARASIQLGHCGYFASPSVIGKRPMGASPKFNLFRLSYCRRMSQQDIKEKVNDFIKAAEMAKASGFDAIEIHAGHGYLISQFLSPYTNKRKDKFGGSLENRTRFPGEIIKGVRKALGKEFPILVKMNLRDGMKGGLELDEAIETAKLFEKLGASAIIPSSGFTSKTPFRMLRGMLPISSMVANQKKWYMKLGLLLFGKMMVQEYPFEKLFHLDDAKKVKEVLNIPVIYIGGITSKEDTIKVLDAGFDFVQLGRTLILDPDFPNKMKQNIGLTNNCDHCNRCVAAMDGGGVYCVSGEKGFLE